MGNSLRCCLACVLPCGALDLIRIVHLNGHVDELTRPMTAGEILQANPNHVLSKPCSQGVVRKILILSPDSELKRGSIYFLIPDTSLPEKKKTKKKNDLRRRRKTLENVSDNNSEHMSTTDKDLDLTLCEKYLEDVMLSSEEKTCSAGKENRHRRRHSRSASVSTWRPHLDSIDEDLN
uniref:6,7-dimethyl-8-ribityllumazine synthase n=1 Tax=Noccaea caerulescens TaxID=107243 RepID=A0A1J3EBK2_NOCCA